MHRIRRPALMISLAIHVLIVALLLWLWVRPPPRRADRALKTFTIAGPPGTPAPRHAAIVSPLPPRTDSPIEVAPPVNISAGGGGGGIACPVAAGLQAALLADPLALAELAELSPADRSVANAIVLWSGPLASDPAPDVALRPTLPINDAIIVTYLQSLSPDCLDAPQSGPNFIYVNSQNGTNLTVAIGSGSWRWHDLLDSLTSVTKPEA